MPKYWEILATFKYVHLNGFRFMIIKLCKTGIYSACNGKVVHSIEIIPKLFVHHIQLKTILIDSWKNLKKNASNQMTKSLK